MIPHSGMQADKDHLQRLFRVNDVFKIQLWIKKTFSAWLTCSTKATKHTEKHLKQGYWLLYQCSIEYLDVYFKIRFQ